MSGDASGKPTPSYKEILRSKDKAVSEANTLLMGERFLFIMCYEGKMKKYAFFLHFFDFTDMFWQFNIVILQRI